LIWNDFAINPANQFRFMIEPRLKINDDLGIIDLDSTLEQDVSEALNQTVSVKNAEPWIAYPGFQRYQCNRNRYYY
jgi:hypothetical protein